MKRCVFAGLMLGTLLATTGLLASCWKGAHKRSGETGASVAGTRLDNDNKAECVEINAICELHDDRCCGGKVCTEYSDYDYPRCRVVPKGPRGDEGP